MLARHTRYIHEDKSRLGEQVSIQGDREIQQVAATINFMSTELRNLYGTLQYVATTDPQTQLPNRLQMDTSIEQLISFYQESGFQFALLLFAVEQAKPAGVAGTAIPGERLIPHVAARLREVVRSTDVVAPAAALRPPEGFQDVARLDGNEFAVLLPGAGDHEQAVHAAALYAHHLKSPLVVDDAVLSIDLNVGIALFPKHATTASRLLRRAGTALAEARRLGNDIHVFDEEHEYHSIQRFDLEHDLRRALARGQLSLHYQPQVDMRSRRLLRAEALMRWLHHENDVIPPDVFIPLAEQINVIRPLTHWALEQAIRDCARWRAAGHSLGVSVNVAPGSLRDPDFVRRVLALLDQHRLPAAQLALEVTARGHHGHLAGIKPGLTELAGAGVCICIDDPGMGYATHTQLRQLPLRQLKIDRSLVLGMLNDEHDELAIRSTVDIARQRGLETVAEGVELQSHWDKLSSLGVDFAQGFLIAHPMSHDELTAWLGATTAGRDVWVPHSAAR
jgi:diguanylate cyclase (GGDEF)-like protein